MWVVGWFGGANNSPQSKTNSPHLSNILLLLWPYLSESTRQTIVHLASRHYNSSLNILTERYLDFPDFNLLHIVSTGTTQFVCRLGGRTLQIKKVFLIGVV